MGLFKLRKQNSETANEVADVDEWLKALDADVDIALAGAAPAAASPEDKAEPNVDVAAALAGSSGHAAPTETPAPTSSTEVTDAQTHNDVWHLPDLDDELPTTSGPAAFEARPSYKLPSDVSGTTVDPSDFAGATFDPTSLQLESLGSAEAKPLADRQSADVKPFEPQPFEPQQFESQSFESQSFEPQSFEPQSFEPQSFEPQQIDRQPVDLPGSDSQPFENEPAAGFAILHSADDLPSRGTSPTAEFGIPDDIPLWGQAEPAGSNDLVSPVTPDPTIPDRPIATESAFSDVFDDAHRSVEALRPEPDASPVAAPSHDDHEALPQPSYDLADFGVVLDSSPDSTAAPTFDDVDCATSDSSIGVPEGVEAATCLAILGLDRNVTWTEVKTAHGSLISDHLAAGESDPERAQLARSIRREINTAYVSLRLMNGPDKI